MLQNKSILELMESIPQYFVAERAEGVNANILFRLHGEQGGEWTVTIENKQCKVSKEVLLNPQLEFIADAQDCLDILTGELDGMKAYLTGKLRLKGDIKLAMKITSFFRLDQ
jgi:putative sterol carrier protein